MPKRKSFTTKKEYFIYKNKINFMDERSFKFLLKDIAVAKRKIYLVPRKLDKYSFVSFRFFEEEDLLEEYRAFDKLTIFSHFKETPYKNLFFVGNIECYLCGSEEIETFIRTCPPIDFFFE